jgi:hypothetical protein
MNLTQIREMVEADLKIDQTSLDVESLRTPQLHNKYLCLLHDETLSLTAIEHQMRRLAQNKREWYTGVMSKEKLDELGWEPYQKRILRQDLDAYVDADGDILHLEAKFALQREKVNYLSSITKQITSRGWDIKNAIEWKKFINGTI